MTTVFVITGIDQFGDSVTIGVFQRKQDAESAGVAAMHKDAGFSVYIDAHDLK